MNRPYVTLKAAISLDGYLDDLNEERLILSSSEDLQAVKKLRSDHDAIFVGANTIRKDNPSLMPCPLKITITRSGELDPESNFFQDDPSIVFYTAQKPEHLSNVTELIKVPGSIEELLEILHQKGVKTLLVEGGSQILTQFLDAGCFDRLRLAIAPIIIGDPQAPKLCMQAINDLIKLEPGEFKYFGNTAVLNYINKS